MTLQFGEFLDDPASLLDSSFMDYDSSNEACSDASSDHSTHHPDGHLTIANTQSIKWGFTHSPTHESRVALFREVIENDQWVWSSPHDGVHIPFLRDRVTIAYQDWKKRFRVVVRARDLHKDIRIGQYLIRLSLDRSHPRQTYITDIHLREPLSRQPLMISAGPNGSTRRPSFGST
jgi:hypothetical protein